MADFRSVQTRMWREDEWFDSLDTEGRLLWIYLFTNPSSSPAGIYRLTMRTMSNESRIPFDITCELMERFAADKKAYYNGGVVWVVNMRRLQFPDLDGSGAWQVGKKMQDDINAIPDTNPLKGEYLKRNGYPIIQISDVNGKQVKTVSIQYGYPIDTQSVNSNSNSNITETVTEVAAAPPLTAPAKPKRERKVKADKPEVPEQVTWFRSVIGRFPPKELYPQVIAVVDGRRDSELLSECWRSWIAAGYNRANFAWFLDWYKSGHISRRNGAGLAASSQSSAAPYVMNNIRELS